MATMVRLQGVFTYDGSLWFQLGYGLSVKVRFFHNGVMFIEPIDPCTIDFLAENVAGCFEKGSNLNGLEGIDFYFKGATVSVMAKNATPEKIVKLWNEEMEKNRIEYEERRKYMETPEYRAKRAKALKVEYRRRNVEELVKHSMQTVELEFKDDEAHKVWDDYVERSSEKSYNAFVARYAEYWAKFMQYLMAKHEGITVTKIAKQASCDANLEEYSFFQLGCAVNILSRVWKHGEALLEWFNKMLKEEYNC